jgi:hypothetical protein
MTRNVCTQACVQKGAKWAAIRDTTCYCGQNFDMGSGYFVPADFCSIPCKGNSSETCGDNYDLNTFNLTNSLYVAPQNTSVGLAGYQGCYADSGVNALSAYKFSDSKMTPDMCKSYCNQLGYSLAGTESGNWCFCDNTFRGGQMLPDSQCSTACAGNSTVNCGGSYTLSLYNSSAASYGAPQSIAAHPVGYKGCYAATLLTSKVSFNYTIYPSTLSVSSCKSTCAYFGYPLMALFGNSCNCGTQIGTTSQYADAFCNAPCKSSNETCGGSQYTDVYATLATDAPDTSALRSRGWVGCYQNPSNGVALGNYTFTDSKMTPQLCQNGCQQVGNWKLSGVQGSTCTCGNQNLGTSLPPSSCSTACATDSSQLCGGPYAYSIYSSSNSTSSTSAAKPSGWKGCYQEGANSRALGGYTFSSSSMTSALCRKACAFRGYALAGTEYSSQ